MPQKTSYDTIEAGQYYHVYNRAVGNERLFFTNANYEYFLRKYKEYLSGSLQTFAYCLMPNHFHFLVKINEDLPEAAKMVGEQFRRFFVGYSQAINKQEKRMGNLFMRQFKRRLVADETDLITVVNYIHRNPIHHKLCDHPEKHMWNSFHHLILNEPEKPGLEILTRLDHNEYHFEKKFISSDTFESLTEF